MANKTHSDEKRLQLALALCRLLQTQEYSSISVHDIAREAGMNHGLIHYYFGSKDSSPDKMSSLFRSDNLYSARLSF